MHVNLDPLLVDKIVSEVKSQGVFDQFRKDSMADVDTKPAYQNLRQRVENTVNKFLSAQTWTPDMNKNQLRERLRKHITEAGFLDVGVERIVDQVVNPKISSVFQPKIEEIAYKYLGIPKPQPSVVVSSSDVPPLNGILKIETDLLPTDLEQVSPDSDKCTVKSDSKDEMDIDDKIDDFESPAFEPIEKSNSERLKIESELESKIEEVKESKTEEVPPSASVSHLFAFKKYQSEVKDESSSEDWDVLEKEAASERAVKSDTVAPCNVSPADATQESQLSQVSSDSRLSIVTNGNTQDDQSTACEIKEENNVNISEEAQMPKFSENSNSCPDQKPSEPLHFDIKKDEIIFEGTERKKEPPSEDTSPNISDEHRVDSSLENKTIDTSETSDVPLPSHEFSFEKDSDFKFSKIEVKVDLEEVTKTTSLDDSVDRDLHIIEKSEISQCSMSQTSIKSPMAKPKSPSATSSPIHSRHKSTHRDKEHSSSRHKKYSKDRRSDRDKDKDKYSSSSHKIPSSSSSRYHSSKSSSSHRTSGGMLTDHHHHHHRSSSSSVHKSKSSSCYGKTSRSYNDSKESSRSRDRSKSRSDKTRNKSSKEKSDRNKTLVDDHYSSKHKWRKSTDSNDEDSSQEGSHPRGPKDSSNSQDNVTNGTHNNSNASSGTSIVNNPNAGGSVADSLPPVKQASQNIVILDKLLENSKRDCIEVGIDCVQGKSTTDYQVKSPLNAQANSISDVQINVITDDKVNCIPNDKVNSNTDDQVNSVTGDQTTKMCPYNGEALFYFENEIKTKEYVETRLNVLTQMMENFRSILKSSLGGPREPSTTESESGNASQETDTNSNGSRLKSLSPVVSPSKPATTLTSATLTIDCIQYESASISHCLTKRFKFDETVHQKVSPTSSELSVNSKENEFMDKNSQSDSDSLGSRDVGKCAMDKVLNAVVKRKVIVNRNQRYSSEDLYKPRPILSQRSKRRGLDAVI